ncbi:MAG: type II toxin-antitoxin system Phd/YefM family antitoxin [Thermoleophilia bacterium]
MVNIAKIIPITDFRHDAARILKEARSSNEPLIITQRGRAAAVMLSVEAYEQAEHDRQLLRVLAQGDKEVAAGEGYDLDDVIKEADAILGETP